MTHIPTIRENIPAHGLSLGNITADARLVDWPAAMGENCEGWRAILPTPTVGDVQNYSVDCPDNFVGAEPFRILTPVEREAFERADGHEVWRDSFDPMMNVAWPVDLAYGVEPARAADLIAIYAPSCVLIELDEETRAALYGEGSDVPQYVIALTGGGMDLTDNIAAAYLACGCVPPLQLLERLAGTLDPKDAHKLPLMEAYRSAREWCEARRDGLMREFGKLVGGVAL